MRFSVTLPFQLAWDLIAWCGQGIGVGEPALLCVLPTADWAEHPEGNGLAVTPPRLTLLLLSYHSGHSAPRCKRESPLGPAERVKEGCVATSAWEGLRTRARSEKARSEVRQAGSQCYWCRRRSLPPLLCTIAQPHASSAAHLQQVAMEVEVPNCKCGQPAELRTVRKEGPNHGRTFWG